jgi:uncharacterized membrane protein
MKAITVVGVVLIVLGILALVYQGIPTKSERDVISVGPMQTSIETKRTIVLPPIVGGLVLAAGVVLVVMGFKKKS